MDDVTTMEFQAKGITFGEILCDVCARRVAQVGGVSIYFNYASEQNKLAILDAIHPYSLKDYSICCSCFLKSLGVFPDKITAILQAKQAKEAING